MRLLTHKATPLLRFTLPLILTSPFHKMSSPESANIRPLNPESLRSSDTVHPGSSHLSDFVEKPLPDDDPNVDIPLDVSINSPLKDQLREADTEYPFSSPMLDQPSTPLPNKAVQRLLDQDGDMASPLSPPPIVANDEVLPPLSDEIEQTRFVSQQELAELDGINTCKHSVRNSRIAFKLTIRRCR